MVERSNRSSCLFLCLQQSPSPPYYKGPRVSPRKKKKRQKKWAMSSFLCKVFLGFSSEPWRSSSALSISSVSEFFSLVSVLFCFRDLCFLPKKERKKSVRCEENIIRDFFCFLCVCRILMMQRSQETHNQNHNAVCVVMTVYSSRASLALLASASSGHCCTWSWISVPFFCDSSRGERKIPSVLREFFS